jgi:hypothetical protein
VAFRPCFTTGLASSWNVITTNLQNSRRADPVSQPVVTPVTLIAWIVAQGTGEIVTLQVEQYSGEKTGKMRLVWPQVPCHFCDVNNPGLWEMALPIFILTGMARSPKNPFHHQETG